MQFYFVLDSSSSLPVFCSSFCFPSVASPASFRLASAASSVYSLSAVPFSVVNHRFPTLVNFENCTPVILPWPTIDGGLKIDSFPSGSSATLLSPSNVYPFSSSSVSSGYLPPQFSPNFAFNPSTTFSVSGSAWVQKGGGGQEPYEEIPSQLNPTRIPSQHDAKLFRQMQFQDKSTLRNKGASDFVKVELANVKQVKDAISTCIMDIDFVAITGLGSRLFEDKRICELLSGGQARVYPKCQREVCRRHDGGLILTFGVIHLWALGKPLVRGSQLLSVDEDDDTGFETQVHMRNHIDTQLKEFHEFFSNQPFRPSLLEALVRKFGSLELTLYRVGAKHDVSLMVEPSRGLVRTLEELSNDFKVDIALAMTLKIESYYMGVDKLGHHKKHLFAFSNQDQVNNLLIPDGHMKIEEMYRLVVYNDMIHHGHLKDSGSHEIDVKMSHEPKTKPTLWSLAVPSIIKKLQSLEKGLFEKSSLDNQSWLDKSGLRIEMYMKLVPGSSVSVLKGKMENFIKEELIITMIKLDEMEIFLKNRFQVCKMVLAEIMKHCKAVKRIPNSTETFMVLKLYSQIVEGVLHKKRSSDIREIDKYNVGHRYDAFFVPFLQFRYLKCIDDCIWDEMTIVCKCISNVDNSQHCAVISMLLAFAMEALTAAPIDPHRQKFLLQALKPHIDKFQEFQTPKLGTSSTDKILKVRSVPEFCQKVLQKCSTTYLRSRPLIISIWDQLGKFFETIPEKLWPSAITLEKMIVRLDPNLVLFLDPSEKGSTELLQKLKELVDQYDQATFTQLIEDGLTSMYDNVDYAWVTPLYTEIINGMLECETQWRVRGGAGIVPISFQDLEEFKAVWIRIFYARLTHQSDEDHVTNISQRLERKRHYSDTFSSLTHYRVIDYFDIASEFWRFLWQGMKLYFGLLRYPGKTMADIFKPHEKHLCNMRTATTSKIKKCHNVMNRGFPFATMTQLLYSAKIFVATTSLSVDSPSSNAAATSLNKLHFTAVIPIENWDRCNDSSLSTPAAFYCHDDPMSENSPSFVHCTFDDIFDAFPELDGQSITSIDERAYSPIFPEDQQFGEGFIDIDLLSFPPVPTQSRVGTGGYGIAKNQIHDDPVSFAPMQTFRNVARILKNIQQSTYLTNVPIPCKIEREVCSAMMTFDCFDWGTRFDGFFATLEPHIRLMNEAKEIFRCFWIHLSIPLQIHPFQMQEAFRFQARQVLNTNSELNNSTFQDVLELGSFVDASILLSLWPKEFHGYTIIIWNKNQKQWHIFDPYPDILNKKEIVLRLHDGHYTLMKPCFDDSMCDLLNQLSVEDDLPSGHTLHVVSDFSINSNGWSEHLNACCPEFLSFSIIKCLSEIAAADDAKGVTAEAKSVADANVADETKPTAETRAVADAKAATHEKAVAEAKSAAETGAATPKVASAVRFSAPAAALNISSVATFSSLAVPAASISKPPVAHASGSPPSSATTPAAELTAPAVAFNPNSGAATSTSAAPAASIAIPPIAPVSGSTPSAAGFTPPRVKHDIASQFALAAASSMSEAELAIASVARLPRQSGDRLRPLFPETSQAAASTTDAVFDIAAMPPPGRASDC